MVLEKDSSILGYPGEVSKPLMADHHDVCKYKSMEDPNYITIRNMLKTIISRLASGGRIPSDRMVCQNLSGLTAFLLDATAPAVTPVADHDFNIEAFLGVSEAPEGDLDFFTERWMPGTCEWILSEKPFLEWFSGSAGCRLLWLHALPATGKSVLSAYVIKHLQGRSMACQYYFFRFGNQPYRSLTALLRSLAFQIARQLPEFRNALQVVSEDGFRVEKADARTIWQKLFVSKLFKLNLGNPVYWILDAIDESDSPKSLVELLSALSKSALPLRVMVVSRYTSAFSTAFSKLSTSVTMDTLSLGQNHTDIRFYVEEEMEGMHGSDEFRNRVTERIMEKAEGNFLWVHLASQEILQCNTQDDIEQVLEELPAEMKSMYYRMDGHIARGGKPADVELARSVFTWVICSRRPLCLEELSQILQPLHIMDLRHTLNQVCGQFVVVDSKGYISMVHQTAREFLTTAENLRCSVDLRFGHEILFAKCMLALLEPSLRRAIDGTAPPTLMSYSATSWAYHLNLSDAGSEESLTLLVRFLQDYPVLTWIHYLTLSNDLKYLAYASQALASFVQKRKRLDSSKIPTLHRLRERELVEIWATDLVKVLGKFGGNLLDDPLSIYKLIPQFSPRSSAIYRQFGKGATLGELSISGLSNTHWDDSVARIFIGSEERAERVIASDRHFAALTSKGVIVVWDALSFQEIYRLAHQEHVTAFCFNEAAGSLVSYGFRSTRIWDLLDGRQSYHVSNPVGVRALGVTFARADTAVLAGFDDRSVRILSLSATSDGWQILDPGVLQEETVLDGAIQNSPCCMTFSPSATQIAVGYRNSPLSVWAIDSPRLIGRCSRSNNRRKQSLAWTGVDRVVWHPGTEEILGLYSDGCVFKWHPFHQQHQELYANASEITCSREGTLFAASDVDGNVKLYNFQHFILVYKLSWENPVVGLTFSPDCRRFYDVRGAVCSVWEPNVLIRQSDTDDRGSETFSDTGSTTLASMASETHVDMPEPILALAAPPEGDFCSAGDDEGVVYLFDDRTGRKHELWRSPSQMPIDHLVWSPDSKYLACVEVGGKMTVKSVLSPPAEIKNGKWTASPVFDIKTQIDSGGVSQILLDPSSQYLFVTSQTSTQVWSLETGLVTASLMAKTPGSPQRWFNHPLHEDRLISWTPTAFTTYLWSDLTELSSTRIESQSELTDAQPLSPCEDSTRTERCTTTLDARHILLQTSHPAPNHTRTKETHIYDLHTFEPLILPTSILARVNIALNILPSQHFVFLDLSYWLCSFRLGSSVQRATKHFFLPKDWINPDSLALCTVAMDGAFLYPRNGEVAVIRWAVGG
jgi:hypothetical protein